MRIKTVFLATALSLVALGAQAGPAEDFEQCYQALAHQDYPHCVVLCSLPAENEELDGAMRSSAYSNRGICYEFNGSLRQALQDHEMAIELWPENGAAYANRAFLWVKNGELGMAEADARKALELDPSARVPAF